MTVADRQTMWKKSWHKPFDTQVQWFQAGSSACYFEVPLAITCMVGNGAWTNETNSDFLSHDFAIECICSAPASCKDGDKKIHNCLNGGMARYQSKWRITGLWTWPTSPSDSQITFTADEPVIMRYLPGKVEVKNPKGQEYSISITHGGLNNYNFVILGWADNVNQIGTVSSGIRFYWHHEMSASPNLAYERELVPCLKGGIPYICDLVSGELYPQKASGPIVVGPTVAPRYREIEAW